jgi:ADP-ribose pyrophosphatase YjhB (NUDIX family)
MPLENTPLELKFAPREIFEKILEYAVIPTFDLVLEFENRGVILLKRSIPPYQDLWALPGLRMFKPEEIEDTLRRIAAAEVGVRVDPERRMFLGQFVGKFKEECCRQDLSTAYYLKVSEQNAAVNAAHFTESRFVSAVEEIPPDTGEMYRFYLAEFFLRRARGEI